MTVINTNVKALAAQNAMTVNARSMSKAMEQLSTGRRINSASDDAAGLAISAKMTAQIGGLNQAIRNANDGISMLQTAEGAMVEVTDMLQRMRDLAVQSATDTNTSEDRGYLNVEFQALKTEIDRVAKTAEWNGQKILNGTGGSASNGSFTFQVGANNGSEYRIDHTIQSLAARGAATVSAAVATTAGGTAAQTSTITVATPAAGNSITVTVNDKSYEYVITESDMSGADATADATNVATSLTNFLKAKVPSATATFASSAAVVTMTGATAGTPVAISTAVAGSGLSVAGSTSVDAIDTRANAQSAIAAVGSAIQTISDRRASLGAVINRMTFAVDVMSQTAQNTEESRSRILDTDYAKATTELARTQIIQQAATAMLAQANQQPASVLSLLQ